MRLKTYFLFTFLICATLLSACVDTDKSQGGERVDYSASSYSGSGIAASAVIAPEIPTSMVFANETIDLTKYDRSERLDR